MIIEAKLLKETAALKLSQSRWGVERIADKSKIQTDSDKAMLCLGVLYAPAGSS